MLALLSPVALAAQAPGYSGLDARQLRAQYRAEVIGQMNRLLGEWSEAWSTDNLEELSRLYVDEAVLIPPGEEPIRGLGAIRSWFGEHLPGHSTLDAFLQDFDAAGGMAMGENNYRVKIQPSAGGGELNGRLVTILLERGNRWMIRSQVFMPH